MGNDLEGIIIEQLSEIQRSLGSTISTVEAIKEEVKEQGIEAGVHREVVKSQLNNALTRVAELEKGLKTVTQTLEKTVAPLLREGEANKNKIIGFGVAMGLVGTGISGVVWFFFGGGLDMLLRSIAKMLPPT